MIGISPTMKPPNRALLLYLTWINPVVALAVLILCCRQPFEKLLDTIGFSGPAMSPRAGEMDFMVSYFMGKGIYCSFTLFLFGLFFRAWLLKDAERPTSAE